MRDVRESKRYSEQCAALGEPVRRLDEMTDGIVWAAHVAAEMIPEVLGTDLRVQRTVPFPGAPRIRVFLRIEDDDHVELVDIEIIEEDPDEPTE